MADEQTPIIGYALVVLGLIAMAAGLGNGHSRPWLFATAVAMAVMGHLDDRRQLPAWAKFLVQLGCVLVLLKLDGPLREAIVGPYGNWGIFWAIFFVLGLTNAVNFVDGIDGLAGVCLFVGTLGYLLFTQQWWASSPHLGFASIAMGSIVPFLYFNVIRRKGFLGNVGSYFFSYVLAILHLSLSIPAEYSIGRVSVSALCFIVPIADSLLVITMRLLSNSTP